MTKTETKNATEQQTSDSKLCGVVMPIAPMNGYTREHWLDIKNIIKEAAEDVEGIKFRTEIVSNSEGEIDIIQKRIIQNLYNAEIVVCDISGRNPNVMFELGMRLAFDKPTIIIKDDATDFIFDTSSIEHLIYPKDLRFQKIVEFKKELSRRIKITYEKSVKDPKFSTFLGNFGEFKIPTLNQATVSSAEQLILEEISSLKSELNSVKREVSKSYSNLGTLNITKYNSSSDYYETLINNIFNYIDISKDMRNPRVIVKDLDYIDYIDREYPLSGNFPIEEQLKAIKSAQHRLQTK
ncbi:hypothetical protein [Bacillus thuringiensis]|uniref:hypothetical protein n=1 Tax=Bacillus thuringiensis TaxID=1428 RepID=UPI0021D69D33|nr:hypothetical protein [Bacillus thuringiensis]MCU7663770.1 hypothetical protein [Bacillus thuringiensis]